MPRPDKFFALAASRLPIVDFFMEILLEILLPLHYCLRLSSAPYEIYATTCSFAVIFGGNELA